jgi:NAD-dependent histone deacetylase SIR2
MSSVHDATQDFSSPGGLYDWPKSIECKGILHGRDAFSAKSIRNQTSQSQFYTFISDLKAVIDAADPSPTHHFITALDRQGKLLRSYTQNIDGLEIKAASIDRGRYVVSDRAFLLPASTHTACIELHGSIQ